MPNVLLDSAQLDASHSAGAAAWHIGTKYRRGLLPIGRSKPLIVCGPPHQYVPPPSHRAHDTGQPLVAALGCAWLVSLAHPAASSVPEAMLAVVCWLDYAHLTAANPLVGNCFWEMGWADESEWTELFASLERQS